MDATSPSGLWTPAGRTPTQIRNARVKIVGSLIIVTLTVVALALRLVDVA